MLQGRTALVTGSTQGIGLALAQAMAQAGTQVVVHGIEPVDQGAPVAANPTLLPPERIGDVAVFPCSEAAAGITGVAPPVDGGWTAQ